MRNTDFCENTKFLSVESIKSRIFAKRTIFLTSTNLVIIFNHIECANYIQFRAEHCQKYASHEKKLEIKVVWNWILSQKVRESICLSPPGVELWGLKDLKLFYSIPNNFYFKLFFMRCVRNLLLFIYFFIHPLKSNLKCLKSGKSVTGVSQLWHLMVWKSVVWLLLVDTESYGKNMGFIFAVGSNTFNLIPILLAYGFLVERTDLKYC